MARTEGKSASLAFAPDRISACFLVVPPPPDVPDVLPGLFLRSAASSVRSWTLLIKAGGGESGEMKIIRPFPWSCFAAARMWPRDQFRSSPRSNTISDTDLSFSSSPVREGMLSGAQAFDVTPLCASFLLAALASFPITMIMAIFLLFDQDPYWGQYVLAAEFPRLIPSLWRSAGTSK